MRHSITKILFLTLLTLCIRTASAQDELPAAAVADTPMIPMEPFTFDHYGLSTCAKTLTDNPAEALYKTWETQGLFGYPGIVLPDSFDIDLTGYCMPTTHNTVSDIFGYRPRRRRVHYGLDVPVNRGDTIRAAFDGKVRVKTFNRRGYGNYVVIRHENGLETFYGHLSRRDVEIDDWVTAGQVIGLGGSTGRSTGPHLHFELRHDGVPVDPTDYLR